MTSEIVIVSPEPAPASGGLADYTQRVIEQWQDRLPVRVVVPGRDPLPSGPARVLVQYSGYGFSRIGYPRALLRALRDWKKSTPAAVLVLMLHEIWGFWPSLNKNRFVQWLHRRDLCELVTVADAVFTSTASQAEHLASSGAAVRVLPVGSNIRVQAPLDREREKGTAIVFGLPGARLRALRLMQGDLRALASRGVLQKIEAIGKRAHDNEERALLESFELRDGFEQTGELPELEVSRLLARASFGISAQDRLSMTKSGTFMAYAAHALNILSPFADSLGAEPLCSLTNPADASEERDKAEHLRAWQERTASWPEIAVRFGEALGVNQSTAR